MDSGWRMTAPLSERRGQHFSTVLSTGEVLIVGGHYNPAPLTLVEIFNPETETWRVVDSIAVARYGGGGMGVQLEDGDVLLGGQEGNPCERFSTTSETWSTDASFVNDRHTLQLTRLSDGRVLVAGGMNWTLEEVLTSTEIYDPATGQWSEASPMNHGRFAHGQVLLNDGRVLVAGGNINAAFDKTDTAEIFDPVANTWTIVGSLAVSKVGQVIALPTGEGLFVGGKTADTLLQDTEIFDPGSATWRPGPSLLEPRLQHTSTTLADGRVMVVGGRQSVDNGDGRRTVEILDPETMTWSRGDSMNVPRNEHSAVLLPSGDILVTGGATRLGWLDSAEMFAVN